MFLIWEETGSKLCFRKIMSQLWKGPFWRLRDELSSSDDGSERGLEDWRGENDLESL